MKNPIKYLNNKNELNGFSIRSVRKSPPHNEMGLYFLFRGNLIPYT